MGNAKKILVVDDSKVILLMIKSIVNELKPDLEVITANGVEPALEVASQTPIGFFCVDLNMPGKDGFELIADLKGVAPDGKFALFTANIQDAIFDKAKEIGVVCVSKPVNEDSVKQMLDAFDV